jgi:hypothetical protein
MHAYVQSEELPVELREWAREWTVILSHAEWFDEDFIPDYFDPDTRYEEYNTDNFETWPGKLLLPLERLFDTDYSIEATQSDLFAIPVREMQDRLFLAFLQCDFGTFAVVDGAALSRLVDLQLESWAPSAIASLLTQTRCFAEAGEFEASRALGQTLCKVFSQVGQAERNAAVHAVLAECDDNVCYAAHSHLGRGSVFLLHQLFKCGASPLIRDRSGVLLIANVRRSLLRDAENTSCDIEWKPFIAKRVIVLIQSYTPAKWSIQTHHLFPPDFRARVRVLLLCNQRVGASGGTNLSFDPLELLIQWLAIAEVLGTDAIQAEMAKLD